MNKRVAIKLSNAADRLTDENYHEAAALMSDLMEHYQHGTFRTVEDVLTYIAERPV